MAIDAGTVDEGTMANEDGGVVQNNGTLSVNVSGLQPAASSGGVVRPKQRRHLT